MNDNQHLWSQFETHLRPARLVLLGASNLSRSFPLAVETAYQTLTRPCSIHAAMGFGRSYGKESGFLGKKFSGISSSSIWESLERETTPATIAFVTDVGNDLAYEEPVDTIFEWVEACITRLAQQGAQTVLAGLPIEVLRGVSHAKFRLLRSMLFPRCRLTWTVLLGRAEALNERLWELAKSRKLPVFTVPNAWYGFDPIHPRGAYMKDYWRELFALLALDERCDCSRRQSRRNYWRLRSLTTPGVGRKAPSRGFSPRRLTLDDGSSVVLY
jgi:hypothetical protein